jgi:hypothetical protein
MSNELNWKKKLGLRNLREKLEKVVVVLILHKKH